MLGLPCCADFFLVAASRDLLQWFLLRQSSGFGARGVQQLQHMSSASGARAQRPAGSVTLQHVGASQIKD